MMRHRRTGTRLAKEESNKLQHIPMKSHRILILAGALLLATSGAIAEPATPPPNPNASENAKAVLALLQQFKGQREQFIADRKALIAKLQGATDAERKAIIEQLRTEQKARIDEQKALAKQIRDAQKQLRDQRKNGGG